MVARFLARGELTSALPAGDGLALVSSCSAESELLASEVALAGDALGSIDISGIFVPGLNRHDWRAGTKGRVTSFFLTPELRKQSDRTRFLPLCYSEILRLYRQERPRAALFMCSPPDKHGNCSFGTEVAFIAELWREVPIRIAHINPAMPRTPGDPGIPFAEITGYFEGIQPLRTMAASDPDPATVTIAAHVASLIPNRATIQTGLGKVPEAVFAALCSHRGLALHTGLIGDGALKLIRSGAMSPGASALVGVAIGSTALYEGLSDPHFQFRPVSITHDYGRLGVIDSLMTVNSAIEVDLFGQVHAEASVNGFQSGPGGAGDFARAGRNSPGGKRIIALPATAGTKSRIVGAGKGHGPVSLSRFDVDFIVTEHGIADLRLKDHPARASAIIAIAAPEHRDLLSRQWRAIASQF